MTELSCGLVLEGGGMRGLFTVGVLDYFLDAGLHFPFAVGVSAGAAFGSNLKSRQRGRALRYNTRYCADPRYCSFRSLWKTGDLFGAEFCYRDLPQRLDPFDWEAFEKDPMEFYAVCTDVLTGEGKYFPCKGDPCRMLDVFRASASMPLVSRTVTLDGREYLDGGIADSVPLSFALSCGWQKNVVILTQPREYRKKKNRAMALIRLRYGKYPAFVKAMEKRHQAYNEALEEVRRREAAGDAFVIAPSQSLPVGRTEKDPDRLSRAWEIGYQEAEKKGEALLKWAEQNRE